MTFLELAILGVLGSLIMPKGKALLKRAIQQELRDLKNHCQEYVLLASLPKLKGYIRFYLRQGNIEALKLTCLKLRILEYFI